MTWGDRITILVAAGAVTATVAAGTCSTNTRFAEMQADIRELRALVIDAIQARTEEADG